MAPMTKEEFWAEFAEAARGLSARQLGKKLGVPSSNAYRWRVGTAAPAKVSRRFILDELRKARAAMIRVGEPGEQKDADGFPIALEERGP